MLTSSELKIGMIFRFKNCERRDCSGCRFIYYKREVSNTVAYVLKCISDTGHWDLGEATGHNIHSLNNHFTLEQGEGVMYYLHREPNGLYTINKDPELNGVQGEPFENFHSAVYFGRVWQIEWEQQNKGKA